MNTYEDLSTLQRVRFTLPYAHIYSIHTYIYVYMYIYLNIYIEYIFIHMKPYSPSKESCLLSQDLLTALHTPQGTPYTHKRAQCALKNMLCLPSKDSYSLEKEPEATYGSFERIQVCFRGMYRGLVRG